MLAMANQNGKVFGSIPGLANRAQVPVPAVEEALQKFMAPDPYSRTKDFEGRRIAEIDGGWRLLTYEKHAAVRHEDERREYMRNLMQKRRSVSNSVSNVSSLLADVSNVSRRYPPLAHADADADVDKENTKSKPLASQVGEIYELYPKKCGRRRALKEIEAAIQRVMDGEYLNEKRTRSEAIEGIKNRTAQFAVSAAGRRGQFTPHPATWFNRSSYLDDPASWSSEEPVHGPAGPDKPSKAQQRVSHNRAAILSGLGLSPEIGRDGPDSQSRPAAGGDQDLEIDFLEGETGGPGVGVPPVLPRR